MKAQIEDGVYRPPDQLPSTRALAAEFGASRTTITAGYEQLLAEGFIETRQGRRAFVAPALRSGRLSRAGGKQAPRKARLSTFGRRLLELAGPPIATEALQIDFRYGDNAAADLPSLAWRRALTKVMTTSGPRSLRYQDPQGSMELRTALRAYLWLARSLRCGVEQIIIGNGSQQGLDLCSRILLDPGDRFVIETPCYWAARHVLRVPEPRLSSSRSMNGLQTQALKGVKAIGFATLAGSDLGPPQASVSAFGSQQITMFSFRNNPTIV